MFGSQAFVSEYAVNKTDAGNGNLLAALGEAGFLLGLEKNRFFLTLYRLLGGFGQPQSKTQKVTVLFFVCSDIVGMASYAPLFVNTNDRRFSLTLVKQFSFE